MNHRSEPHVGQPPETLHGHSSWYSPFTGDPGRPLWLDAGLREGQSGPPPPTADIVVIGSGLSGASAAYWLQERGFERVLVIDYRAADAATNRNCGHILYGTVESAAALRSLKGEETANAILNLSVDLCHEVRATIAKLAIDCDYRQDGYLVMAMDQAELGEIEATASLLQGLGIDNRLLSAAELRPLGFRGVKGGRFEAGGARAHPVKFRNGLLRAVTARGGQHFTGVKVDRLHGDSQGAVVHYLDRNGQRGLIQAEAVIIAANAYSPLFCDEFVNRRLIEPFRGQIIASDPLPKEALLPQAFQGAHSFDHGYVYAVISPDHRLVIGGWRNHTPGGEVGTYDLSTNPVVERGLAEFAATHYDLCGYQPTWSRSWSGIMAASRTGLPFIGPMSQNRIYALAGYTGHGFSWAHGSARILADILAGSSSLSPETLRLFSPQPHLSSS